MRNLNTPTHATFDGAKHRARNGIKRVGGTVLAATMITAVGFQSAPVEKAFAETRTTQEVNTKATHTKVVDYCAGFTRSTPTDLKKHGVKIVVRYTGYQSGIYGWKNLNKSEANALRKNGIDIASVYETSAGWMRGGYHAGVAAAKLAKADIVANGGPKRPFVYFACDEDAVYTGAVNAALRGAAHELGADKVGIYGGYTVVDSALKTHSAAKGWQTMAWSRGKVAKGIALYQTITPSAGKLGLDYDSNLPKKDDIGQWGTHAVTTSVEKKPVKKKAAAPVVKQAGKPAGAAPAPAKPVAAKTVAADATTPSLLTLILGALHW